MTSRQVTASVYLLIVAAGVVLELLSRRQGSRIPRLADVFSRAMRTRSGRVGILAGWVWVGMHFFAR